MMAETAAAESEREPINNTSCFLELEGDEVFCRICLEEDGDDLIAPCRCSGTSKWVHRACLDQWRANHTDRIAFSQCTECLFNYRLRYVGESATLRAAKYWCFVSCDICLLTALVQIVVLVLGLFVWGLDRGDALVTNACRQRSGCYFATYYSSGVILLLMCLGIHGLVLLCLNDCSPQQSIQTYTGDNENTDTPWTSRSRQRQNDTRRQTYSIPGNDCCCCCYCDDDSCGNCCETARCSCPSTARDAELCLIIIAVILVLVGFVVAIVIAVIAFQRILQRHLFRRYKRRLVEEFQVLDLASMNMEDLERHDVRADESVGLPAAPELSSESVDSLKKLGFME